MDAWIKNESILVGKGDGGKTRPCGFVLSDTMKEWNNICGPRRDAVVLLKRGEIPH